MSNSDKSQKIKFIALSGLFAAMIFILTLIHVPTGQGYTHAGDGMIYLAACILPAPYAVAASAIGGVLADGLSGAAIWIPATIVVKILTAICFTNKSEKIITIRNIFGIIPSLILCVVGYSLYEGIFIVGSFSLTAIGAAFVQTPAYLVQVFASSVLYIIIGVILDKINFKKSIYK